MLLGIIRARQIFIADNGRGRVRGMLTLPETMAFIIGGRIRVGRDSEKRDNCIEKTSYKICFIERHVNTILIGLNDIETDF